MKRFYKYHFIGWIPDDVTMALVSRTVGTDGLVDEFIFTFTHTSTIDWMLPGIPPTGKVVEIPMVAVVHFRGDKLVHELSTGTGLGTGADRQARPGGRPCRS